MFFWELFWEPKTKKLDFQKTSQTHSLYLSKAVALGLKNATKKMQVARNSQLNATLRKMWFVAQNSIKKCARFLAWWN